MWDLFGNHIVGFPNEAASHSTLLDFLFESYKSHTHTYTHKQVNRGIFSKGNIFLLQNMGWKFSSSKYE